MRRDLGRKTDNRALQRTAPPADYIHRGRPEVDICRPKAHPECVEHESLGLAHYFRRNSVKRQFVIKIDQPLSNCLLHVKSLSTVQSASDKNSLNFVAAIDDLQMLCVPHQTLKRKFL